MITKEKKTEIINQYARKPGDTGSPEVQVAVLTERIQELTAVWRQLNAAEPIQIFFELRIGDFHIRIASEIFIIRSQ